MRTRLTQDEAQQAAQGEPDRRSTPRLWSLFVAYVPVAAQAGYAIGQASIALVDRAGLFQTAVGTFLTALSNSLPELVTAIATVRIGAVNLAVGDIIGANAFEVLFLAARGMVYRDGSLYHEFTPDNTFTTVLAIFMTGVLPLGMLRRQKQGIARIGWVCALVPGLYAGSVLLVFR